MTTEFARVHLHGDHLIGITNNAVGDGLSTEFTLKKALSTKSSRDQSVSKTGDKELCAADSFEFGTNKHHAWLSRHDAKIPKLEILRECTRTSYGIEMVYHTVDMLNLCPVRLRVHMFRFWV